MDRSPNRRRRLLLAEAVRAPQAPRLVEPAKSTFEAFLLSGRKDSKVPLAGWTMTKFQWFLVVAMVGLVVGPRVAEKVQRYQTPAVVSPVAVPSATLQAKVGPITVKLNGHTQAQELGQFYLAYADTLSRDRTLVTNTQIFRTLNERVVTLRFNELLNPKVPGLAADIDGVLVSELGVEVIAFEPLRPKAVAALQAIGWACLQAKQ